MNSLFPSLLLYAHDPGGSVALLACIPALQKAGYRLRIMADGPAALKLTQAGFSVEPFETSLAVWSEQSVLTWLSAQGLDGVLTGTSANAYGEKWLWKAAETLDIPSVAVLDQWLNYGIRFAKEGLIDLGGYQAEPKHVYLPSAVAVMDSLAKRELLMAVPELRPEQVWVTGFAQAESKSGSGDGAESKLLSAQSAQSRTRGYGHPCVKLKSVWLSEPLKESYGTVPPVGYTEFDALEAVLNELHAFGSGMTKPHEFAIKLHPKESADKYSALLTKYSALPVHLRVLGPQVRADEVMAEADVVWGMASMALIEAALMDKPVISVQPKLQGEDPLVLSRLGWLDTCVTHEALVAACYSVFVDGNLTPYKGRFVLPWPREIGATGRELVQHLQQLIPLQEKETAL